MMTELKTHLKKIAMQLLSRREYSYQELRDRLSRLTEDEELIDAVLQEFVQKKWQSDARFAEAYVCMRIKRGYGPERIQQELLAKGISEDLIAQWLWSNDRDWEKLALQVKNKKFGASQEHDFVTQEKQKRFLQYRGFTLDQIQSLYSSH